MKTQRLNFGYNISLAFKLMLLFVVSIILSSCEDDDNARLPSTLMEDIANEAYVDVLERHLGQLPEGAQVAVGLVHDGMAEYVGVINSGNVLNGTDNAEKIFEIGSITKVLTGVCLGDMATTGEISLTETLQEQFDYAIREGGSITMKQLANHTSGLPRMPTNEEEVPNLNLEDPYSTYTPEHLKSYLQNHVVLNSESGTAYEYSNLGMGILGYVLAQRKNVNFETLLQQTIFEPLGMNSTTTLLDSVDSSRLVEGRNASGVVVPYWNFDETLTAAGSVKSSVVDVTRFIAENFEDDVAYNLAQEKTFDRGNNFYLGLGWLIYEEDDYVIHSHDGGTGGFSSMLMLDKNKEIGVIVLSNVEGFHEVVTPLCNSLLLAIDNQ